MKKIIIIYLFLSFSVLSQAQVNCYLTGGSSHGLEAKNNSIPGFNFGAILDFTLAKKFSLQTGVQINNLKMERSLLTSEYVVNQLNTYDFGSIAEYNFIEIPISLSNSYKLSSSLNLKFNTGLYLSVFTGGTTLLRTSTGQANYATVSTNSDLIGGGFLIGSGLEINKLYFGIEGNANIPDGNKSIFVLKTKFAIRL